MKQKLVFVCFETKNHPQKCGIRFLKVHQANGCFISKTWGHLLDSSEEKLSKLTFWLRYYSLAAFFFVQDNGDITGASWQKTANLQFSPKMCADKGTTENLRIIAAVWVEKMLSWKNFGGPWNKLDQGTFWSRNQNNTQFPSLVNFQTR